MMKPTKLIFFVCILLLPLKATAGPLDYQYAPRVLPMPQVQYMSITADWEDGKMVTKIEPFNDPRLYRYTQVLWTNNAHVPVRMKFGNGPKCEELSDMRLRELDWKLAKTCYVTKKPIPPKGLLQTTFTEQGRYPYEVEFMGENAIESGVITVY